MLGRDRRLIVMRSTAPHESPGDQVFVFGCADGRVMKFLDSGIFGGEMTIEHADREKVILVGPEPAPGTSGSARNVFDWSEKEQTYQPREEGRGGTTTKMLSCRQLRTAAANDLIILANRDYKGPGGGFFPFTHGEGCYTYDIPGLQTCEFRVTLSEDRMISANRREVDFVSNHELGTGAFGYSYVFGCIAGQVRLLFGSDSDYGGDLESPCDLAQPTAVETPEPQTMLIVPGVASYGFSFSNSKTAPTEGQPSIGRELVAIPTATAASTPVPEYDCHMWDDTKSDKFTLSDNAWAAGDGRCCPSIAVLQTFEWRAALQTYVLTAVHYSK